MSKDPGCVAHGVPHNTSALGATHAQPLTYPFPGADTHGGATRPCYMPLLHTQAFRTFRFLHTPALLWPRRARYITPFYILLHNPRNIPCNIPVTNPQAARKSGLSWTHPSTYANRVSRDRPRLSIAASKATVWQPRTRRGAAAIAVSFRRIASWGPDTTVPRLGAPRVPAACSCPRARVGALGSRRCGYTVGTQG